jgi:hypothetical protein
MIRKPHAAFGRILYSNEYEAGYTSDTTTYADSKTLLLFTEGSVTVRDKQTGEVVHQCIPGWFKDGTYEDAVYAVTVNVPSVSWCYDPKVNQNYVPPIEVCGVKMGQSIAMSKGTSLFLCSGTLSINGQNYVAPRQISVKSADTIAVAVTDVYGLDFK